MTEKSGPFVLHFTSWKDEHGVFHGPDGCERCCKPLAPYMTAVPEAEVERYCWGHDTEDAIKETVRGLRDRMEKAIVELHGLAEGELVPPPERNRLNWKAEGVGLALSYVEEVLRG